MPPLSDLRSDILSETPALESLYNVSDSFETNHLTISFKLAD